ncbi:MAG: DUF4321 domain-containing protein, partial [Firmicutes bacterium]|nr:DUF4321 domain-containing protein [Bacillota bacterium]
LLGQLLRPYLPFLAKAVSVGFEPGRPFVLGDVFLLTLGFRLRLDLAAVAGLVLAFVAYRRM